jgi:hypothetical protein
MCREPLAELESVKLSLVEQQLQYFFPIHFIDPSSSRSIGLCRAGCMLMTRAREAKHLAASSEFV